ncbi:tubulin tyrosine ligase 3-like isoform X2 [Lytechinus pictus]|uniref:tubulin tyrosine ligase 3-like isoform X2 n=1 Tax=Lytechinus pictus TaxID=7653 RepID=UPI0030B9CE22
MLQIESVSSRIDHSQSSTSSHDPGSRSGVDGNGSSVVVGGTRIPHQRFSFDKYEQELTFTPKLNATSLKLAHERRGQLKSGSFQRAQASTRVTRIPDNNIHHASSMSPIPKLPGSEFTFKPQMSTASAKIAEGLGTTFMARQEQHLQKQRQKLEQSTKLPLRGRLSPVPNIAKARRLSLKEKENDETSQEAWRTPTSTPNLIDGKESSHGEAASKRSVGGSTPSLLAPVKPGRGGTLMQTSVSFNKLQDSAYCPNTSMSLKRLKGSTKPKHLNHKRGTTYPTEGRSSELEEENEPTSPVGPNNHTRSKTNASPELSPRSKARYSVSKGPNIDRLRNAKIMAEKAMKTRKIFTIQGPYPVVRASLMRRSWVEKEYRLMNPHKYKKKNAGDDDSDSDDDDDIDDDNACDDDTDAAVVHDPDGVCGIMSRMVRNATPSFLWTVRKGAIDYRLLRKDTIVNHFCKNGTFTTKVGLCLSLKSLPWFEERDADTFFPRCYRICADEEKDAFVGDYRISAAIGVMKWIVMKQDGDLDIVMTKDKEEDIENKETDKTDENKNFTSPRNGKALKAKKTPVMLGTPFVNIAIKIVEDFLTSHEHDDIDEESSLLSDEQWDKFITEYYQLTSEGGSIDDTTMHYAYCDSLLNRLRSILPQLDMQGFRNIWIVKPGAKSRGRGIMCMNKLDEILKLVGNPMVKKEGKWVVQKYIERPLLIYQTKFDIRQWFLVTDWNPLTIWWYDACYLRFCTQPFSLDDLGQSIHLSNQSIQKNYDNASARDPNLPEDNMWDSDTFRKYLDDRGYEGLWESVIVPGMKKAIIDSMLCAQDAMEARKNSFELYGADFMLTDDFLPWMLEINASPAMGASTPVTEEMCASVIEDTMKVVLDRKHDKNCDTGKFEILYKGPSVSVPPYIGASICVDGIGVRRPVTLNRQKSINNVISPRQEVDRRSDNQRSKTPGRTDKVSAFQKLGLKTGVTPKATTMEDMKKKLAGSMSTVQYRLQSRKLSQQLDNMKQEIACLARVVCDCQRGSLVVPDPDLDEPVPSSRPSTAMLRLTTATTPSPPRSKTPRPPSHPNLGVSSYCETKVSEPTISQDDPIPKAINFISNSMGQLVTLNESADLSGAPRPGRLGFSQGRTRPNVTRQRRENLAFMKANGDLRSPGPMPAVLTNARR